LIQSVGDAVVLGVAVDELREAHRDTTGTATRSPDAIDHAPPSPR
jgi:hypothetical protein